MAHDRNFVFVFSQIVHNFPQFPPDDMLRKGYHMQNSEVNYLKRMIPPRNL